MGFCWLQEVVGWASWARWADVRRITSLFCLLGHLPPLALPCFRAHPGNLQIYVCRTATLLWVFLFRCVNNAMKTKNFVMFSREIWGWISASGGAWRPKFIYGYFFFFKSVFRTIFLPGSPIFYISVDFIILLLYVDVHGDGDDSDWWW